MDCYSIEIKKSAQKTLIELPAQAMQNITKIID